MTDRRKDKAQKGRHDQTSVQSAQQGEKKRETGKPASGQQGQRGIGSSQGQDSASREEQKDRRPSAGTPDIERGSEAADMQGDGSRDSLVNDSTGAFKERP